MRIFLAIALAFALTACASIQNPVSSTSLYQAELAFDASLKTFNELKDLCVKRVLPPKCRTYVVQGQTIIRNAAAADIAARNFVTKNPTLDATSAISVYSNFLADFKATIAKLSAIQQ